jgi:K+ transporter
MIFGLSLPSSGCRGVMLIWHVGAITVSARLQDAGMPVAAFMARIAEGPVPRVPGTAVFLTRTQRDVPPVLVGFTVGTPHDGGDEL